MTIAQQASTTPRHVSSPTLMRAAIRTLAAIAPPLAVRAATTLFRTPIRARAATTARADETRFAIAAGKHTIRGGVRGNGPLVILGHGWAGAEEQLAPVGDALVARGFRVATFSAIGHGASSGRLSSMIEFRDSLRAVAEHFGDVHAIVAHSMGGAASAFAVSEGVRTTRLVLIAPSANPMRYLDMFLDWLDFPQRLRERVPVHLEQVLGFGWRDLAADAFGPKVDVPTLVIHDREDREVPWSDGAAIAAAIPNAELVTVEALGHKRILRDSAVIARVEDFLQRML